jgi:signal transduction histidine kinase/ActR/RegA family two-component response regulator
MNHPLQKITSAVQQALWDFSSPWMKLPDIAGAVGKEAIEQKIAYKRFDEFVDACRISRWVALLGFSASGAGMLYFSPYTAFVQAWIVFSLVFVIIDYSIDKYHICSSKNNISSRDKEVLFGKAMLGYGVIWGLAGLSLPTNSVQYDAYYVMLITMTNSANIIKGAIYPSSLLFVALPSSIICISILLFKGGGLRYALSLGFSLLAVELYRYVKTSSNMIEKAMLIEEKNKVLLEELEQSNQAKTRFLAAASHDLRQPIHSASLLLGSLDSYLYKEKTTATLIHRIQDSIKDMDRLLGTILETSRLDADIVSLKIQPVSLVSMLTKIKQQFEPIAKSKNIDLQFEIPSISIDSDEFQITRLLSNLISNALRYTPAQGHIKVRCRERHQTLWIQVWDNGRGISKTDQSHIFDEFYRGASAQTSRASGGLGLGLSIVQRIAKNLNHTLLLRSRLGRGSMFAVGIHQYSKLAQSLPDTDKDKKHLANERQEIARLLNGLLLLLIDDDARVLEDMRIFFQGCGCRVKTASSSQAAVRAVQQDFLLPDLIISDFSLQDSMNGAQTIREIQKLMGEAIPALLMTAESVFSTDGQEKFGSLPVVAKPIEFNKLKLTLKKVLPTIST